MLTAAAHFVARGHGHLRSCLDGCAGAAVLAVLPCCHVAISVHRGGAPGLVLVHGGAGVMLPPLVDEGKHAVAATG